MKITVPANQVAKIFSEHIKRLMREGKTAKEAVYHSCNILGIKLDEEKFGNLVKSIENEQLRLKAEVEKGNKVSENGLIIEKVHDDDYKEIVDVGNIKRVS